MAFPRRCPDGCDFGEDMKGDELNQCHNCANEDRQYAAQKFYDGLYWRRTHISATDFMDKYDALEAELKHTKLALILECKITGNNPDECIREASRHGGI